MSEETIPIATLARVYRKIKARMEVLTQEYDRDFGELKEQQDSIASAMREQMRAMEVKSVKTDYGTVMLGIKTRYSTQNWDGFKAFLVKNDVLDLLEKRIAQGNMQKFLTDNPDVHPPGLVADSEYQITVRKPD